MRKLLLPKNEEKRLAALYEYNLLDTTIEEIFDSITWIAAKISDSPISLINVINRETVFVKAGIGFNGPKKIPRETTFCSHAILQSNLMEIPNLEEDKRFKKNPFVIGKGHMRFYAGMPLANPQGYNLGTLCVLDHIPKQLTLDQKETIKHLAKIVMALFESKKMIACDIKAREKTEQALKEAGNQLKLGIEELQQRNKESLLLTEMSRILQSCLHLKEAYLPLINFCQQLFPDASGALYLLKNSHGHLETVALWGKKIPLANFFTSEECWALRLGRAHYTDGSPTSLPCNHIIPRKKKIDSICVPLMAQSEILGLFYLEIPVAKYKNKLCSTQHSQRLLAMTVSEQIALALANIRLREALSLKSTQDPLTNLYNRRFLEDWFTLILHKIQQEKKSLAVIMIDIDHFREFNNTFGHDIGDLVLREVGKTLQKFCRKNEITSRFGGEEFVIVLPDCLPEIAFKRAEALREAVSQLEIQVEKQKLNNITISLGIASFPKDGETMDKLVISADKALYQAKEQGRNRTVMFES